MLCEPTPTRQARPNSERGDSFNSVEDRPLLLQHRMRDALRRQQCPPCCCQLCTLWYCTHTHPAKHRPTASRELCGLSRAEWHNAIFDCTLPRVRRALHTTVLVRQ
jgi:hypothetical protein